MEDLTQTTQTETQCLSTNYAYSNYGYDESLGESRRKTGCNAKDVRRRRALANLWADAGKERHG